MLIANNVAFAGWDVIPWSLNSVCSRLDVASGFCACRPVWHGVKSKMNISIKSYLSLLRLCIAFPNEILQFGAFLNLLNQS
jgi:hypothetical protein